MARIAGVNVPDKKRIPIALTYITGIGHTTAFKICEKLGIDVQQRMGEASEDTLNAIRAEIDSNEYTIEGDLRREVSMNIKRLMDIEMLPRSASPFWSACPRSEYTCECQNP